MTHSEIRTLIFRHQSPWQVVSAHRDVAFSTTWCSRLATAHSWCSEREICIATFYFSISNVLFSLRYPSWSRFDFISLQVGQRNFVCRSDIVDFKTNNLKTHFPSSIFTAGSVGAHLKILGVEPNSNFPNAISFGAQFWSIFRQSVKNNRFIGAA